MRVRATWLSLLLLAACNGSALDTPPPDAGPPPGGLTPEQAAQVVAKIGDKVITLGDFAAALERMDPVDRLRYQSKERRRELLQEIIDVELLAHEARKRGLDKEPDVQEGIRQILRDAMLARAREDMPSPAEITPAEVKAYYDAHPEKYREPERRRVAAIILDDKKAAEKALEAARKATNQNEWNEAFAKWSITSPAKKGGAVNPAEITGDLGLVGPAGDPKGANVRVPNAVRKVAFELAKAGDVHPDLVEADGKFYVVRLGQISPGHVRTVSESDRSIRIAILQKKLEEKEKALEAELRKKFPVTIDEQALAGVKVPPIPDATSGASQAWLEPSAAPPGGSAPGGAPSAAPSP